MNKLILSKIPKHVTCVGVSKQRTLEEIQHVFEHGIKVFAENKAQELLLKATLSQPWEWHFIGHLQTNKVRSILPYVSCIHSVDSIRLLNLIEKEAALIDKKIMICLQLNLTQESSKFGMTEQDVLDLIDKQNQYPHCLFKGIMVMGPASLDEILTHTVFQKAQQLSQSIKKHSPWMDWLSMGMSDDYQIALKYGATHIRLGRILFEE